ncbi:MAG: DUF1217 domain-containing protein [Roseitalea sp.]|jgi:hypothetical protein|nr:DUF1217 domain-containing protein [Roseitalea sp.]MBO6741358.1 DUF1217 domain-containing protein [Roseitalea sp.]
MNTTLVSLNMITRDMDASIERLESRADVQREIEYYNETIGTIKTAEQFVGDTRLFNFAMKAHGLEDMAYAKAFMLKVLNEGTDANDAFANTLSDSRYRDFADTFDFARHGEAATVFTKAQQGVIDKYLVQTLETEAGESDQGVRLALYFERKAPQINSYFDILADPALSEVVRTTLGIPQETATIDIDKQAAMMADRLSLSDLKDPEKLDKLVERFANMWQIENGGQAAAANDPSLALLVPSSASATVSADLLLQIQQIKL